MSAEILLMNGQTHASHGHPDPNVVAKLEGLLEAAKSGHIVGIAYGLCFNDNSTSSNHVGIINIGVLGTLFKLMSRISALFEAP